jgi:hypothetical protein
MTKNISCRRELFKALALLLTNLTEKRYTQKLVRDTYVQWENSSFVSNMSFGEFLQKMYCPTAEDQELIKNSKVH